MPNVRHLQTGDRGERLGPVGTGEADCPNGSSVHNVKTARHILDRLLWQSASVFGRLLYLASLRDAGTGMYRNGLIQGILGEDQIHTMICTAHQTTFSQWLHLNLSQQRGDIARYFQTGDENDGVVVRTWFDEKFYSGLIPERVTQHERELFLQDVMLTLQSLRYDFDVA